MARFIRSSFVALLLALVALTQAATLRKVIHTDKIPPAIGPYSQAVQVDNMVYVSGTLGLNKEGHLVPGVVNQTRQVLDNVGHILQEAGSSFGKVVKSTMFLKDLSDFEAVNAEYARYFTEKQPARSTVQVARIPKDALIEIDVVAIVGEVNET